MLTKYGDSVSDKSLIEAYRKLKIKFKLYSFLERGSDERQYNSPGIDLPIASIFRTKYGEYPEYHTSLDNFDLVTKNGIAGGFKVSKEAIKFLMKKIIPKNNILCEPQMGKRGLYPSLSGKNKKTKIINYMSFLQYADGKNDLDVIKEKLGISKLELNKILKF